MAKPLASTTEIHAIMRRPLPTAIIAGSVLLFPSLYVLYRIFKGNRPFRVLDRSGE